MYQATFLLQENRWAVTHTEYGFVLGRFERQEIAEDLAAAMNAAASRSKPNQE
jgi:hypothetical protein